MCLVSLAVMSFSCVLGLPVDICSAPLDDGKVASFTGSDILSRSVQVGWFSRPCFWVQHNPKWEFVSSRATNKALWLVFQVKKRSS